MIFIDEICSGKEASINNDARNIYDKLSKPEDILNITFKGVVIGEQIYDTILKYTQLLTGFMCEYCSYIRCGFEWFIAEKDNPTSGKENPTKLTWY